MKKSTFKLLMMITVVIISISSISCSKESLDENNPESTELTIDETLAEQSLDPSKLTLDEVLAKQSPQSRSANTYQMKKYVFLRSNGAFGLGHVGVGFELRARINGVDYTSFYCGAVENYSTSFFIPWGSRGNDGWYEQYSTQAEMLNKMRSLNYDKYKFGQKINPETLETVNRAKEKLFNFPTRGYSLAHNNCMNAAYDVLQAFSHGNGLPIITAQYAPNWWYSQLLATLWMGWSHSQNL